MTSGDRLRAALKAIRDDLVSSPRVVSAVQETAASGSGMKCTLRLTLADGTRVRADLTVEE